jgi:hypothetical protein
VLLEGSKIKTNVVPSCPNHAKKARENFSFEISTDGILKSNILLRSPAEAACFVTGHRLMLVKHGKPSTAGH